MRVWVVRHGKAERGSPTGRDADRPLSGRGLRQAAWLGETLRCADAPPVLIVSSGFVRAAETARLIRAVLGCALVFEPGLEAGRGVAEAAGVVAARAGAGSVAVVGHNPQLESLVAWLLEGGVPPGGRLRTGEAVALDL
ncbi:MAG: histidine phosphatase family protein, partial [Phycisphaeraceae bacterium]|nr:histidine phosphatase family protein [Phycisphaeraceae bacterium]